MRSRIDFIAARVEENLEQSGVDEQGNGLVELRWKEWPANAAVDDVTGAKAGDPVLKSETIAGFVHFVSATASVRQFAEVQAGDCILDISPTVNLKTSPSGLPRDDLRFVIGGAEYANKPISDRLATHWDVLQGGRKLFQTVLVRLAT